MCLKEGEEGYITRVLAVGVFDRLSFWPLEFLTVGGLSVSATLQVRM